jgi:hypothetical protein
MLFWIFVIITAAFIIWGIIDDWCSEIPFFGTIVSGVVAFVMLSIIICCHAGVEGDIAMYEQRYESLVYQYENDVYDNDNDLGKRELIKEIQNWNEGLAAKKEYQDDFWIGIFYPNIYDQFEFIELN